MDCDNICGAGAAGSGDIDIRDVLECLRGVSRDELLGHLESIGFYFNEQDIVRQMSRFDIESKRRIMRNAGILIHVDF